MTKEKFRKFLPSVIPLDLTNLNCYNVETCFPVDNGVNYTKIERIVDLSPGGVSFARLSLVIPHKDEGYVCTARIPESDALSLLGATPNKIKKYMYYTKHNDNDVYINRYTLGIIIIEIDANVELDSIPEYCGEEVTGKQEYDELYLSNMRELLRDKRKKKDATINK